MQADSYPRSCQTSELLKLKDLYVTQMREWAMSKKEIRRLWFYGSRIKGTAVESSDLDVAVDLQPNFDLADFILEKEDWLNELASKIPFRLDIKLYEERDDCVCKQGVQDASILVYERGL